LIHFYKRITDSKYVRVTKQSRWRSFAKGKHL